VKYIVVQNPTGTEGDGTVSVKCNPQHRRLTRGIVANGVVFLDTEMSRRPASEKRTDEI